MPKLLAVLPTDIFGRAKARSQSEQRNMRLHVFKSSCDLFLMRPRPTQTEVEQFAELFEHLIAHVPLDVAGPVAERLVRHPPTPLAVVSALRHRGMISAEALITTGTRLPDDFVASVVQNVNSALAALLAKRPDLSAATLQRLGTSSDAGVQVALAQNHAISLPDDILDTLLAGVHQQPVLASALVRHPAVKLDSRLFLAYGREQRDAVILRVLRRQMGETPISAPVDAMQQAKIQRLERQMIKRDLAAAMTTCAEILQIPMAMLAPLMHDDASDSLIVALRAAGLERPAIVRVALSGPERVSHDFAEIGRIARMAEQLAVSTAVSLLREIAGMPEIARNENDAEIVSTRRNLAALRTHVPERARLVQPIGRLFNRGAER